ncbi:MAG: glycosyltransferase family 39 protein [Burkholderiales bacterium]
MPAEPLRRPATPSAPLGRFAGASLAVFVVVVALGALLRLDQFPLQVLLDDEWHAVHQVMRRGPASLVLELGHADYGIPLGLYDWALLHTVGLSETAMRMPMMLCGLAALVAFPLAVVSRVGRAESLAFALLLAISPLLVAYSQIARPYAITVLIGWASHRAFLRYWDGSGRAGVFYAVASAVVVWMHMVIAPFVLAPLAWAAWTLARDAGRRRERFGRLLAIALPTVALIAVALGPPLAVQSQAIAVKSGFVAADPNSLRGAFHLWVGTGSAPVALAAFALGVAGARPVWRALPEARTGTLGLVLTAAAITLARPEWGQVPIVFARYLMPFVPLLLLSIAVGAVMAGRAVLRRWPWKHASALGAALATAGIASATAATGPLPAWSVHPTTHRLGVGFLYDFRDSRNAALAAQRTIPLSPFWSTLATRRRDSIVVAAAPFSFESYDWDAARWERVSHQRVVPGWLTGLCLDRRPGELPDREGLRFANAVRLADARALASFPVDYVAWQKPWLPRDQDRHVRYGDDTAQCEAVLRERFGAPVYEDAMLVVFRPPGR